MNGGSEGAGGAEGQGRRAEGRPVGARDGRRGRWSPRTALDVLNDVRGKVATGELADYEPIPLGMAPLDRMLGGGLRPGELLLIGGAQGTGKTTMALQMARNIAASGQAYVLYVNFEHDDADMLNRLISMESALPHLPNTKPSTGAVKITDVRSEVIRSWATRRRRARRPRPEPAAQGARSTGSPAMAPTCTCSRGSQTASTVENLRELIEHAPAAVRRAADAPDHRLPAEGARSSPSRRASPRRSPTSSTGSRTSRSARSSRPSRSSRRTRRASRPLACATTTCAARRRSTTRPTSS